MSRISQELADFAVDTKYGVPGWRNMGAVNAVLLVGMGYAGETDEYLGTHEATYPVRDC